MIIHPFRNRHLRDWLCESIDLANIAFRSIPTTGSGPFEEREFDDFLRRVGIVHNPSRTLRVRSLSGAGTGVSQSC